jgi:membrane fusion protein (multidrug efflux system)
MRNKCSSAFLLLAGAALLSTGCGKKAQPGAPGPKGPPEVAVQTMRAERVALTTELPGRTAACAVAEIRPQVGGIVQKRLFTEGADVAAGQLLYQIDPSPYQAAFANAQAAQARAKANHANAKAGLSKAKAGRLRH